jgi:hypothetical protein
VLTGQVRFISFRWRRNAIVLQLLDMAHVVERGGYTAVRAEVGDSAAAIPASVR